MMLSPNQSAHCSPKETRSSPPASGHGEQRGLLLLGHWECFTATSSFQTLALWVAHGAFLQIAVETTVTLRCGAVEEVPVVFSPCLMHQQLMVVLALFLVALGFFPSVFVLLLSLTLEPPTRQNELWFYSASFGTHQLWEHLIFFLYPSKIGQQVAFTLD